MYSLALCTLAAALAMEATARPHFEQKRVGGVLAGAPVNNITVSTSGVVQCSQATISWTGTSPPITLSIGSGGFYVGTTPIATLSDIYDDSTTWTVDAAAGTDLIFEVQDAEGQVGYVQNVQVGSSGDDSCLSSASSSATSASSASSYASSGSTTTPYVVSSGSAAAATSSSSKKSKSSKSHSASSTSADIVSTTSSAATSTTSSSASSTTAAAVGTTAAPSGSSSTGTATLAAAGAGSSTGAGTKVVPGGIAAMVVAGLLASLM